ncbi:hypothetical protein SCHPADRAFT_901620 [Schizopora paradoxa]|uniref:HRQ family protein n=1 Tax=Schizopora paradoxa TaxID=27342 RepID=A0A0H2S3S6_9AGAM|nr:hypothetical protein SCHPADRAFT_901620 [Schizopora paradoxa]
MLSGLLSTPQFSELGMKSGIQVGIGLLAIATIAYWRSNISKTLFFKIGVRDGTKTRTTEKDSNTSTASDEEGSSTPSSSSSSDFTYPPIPICKDPLEQRKPPPYRPFRWGKYNITMGIRNMDFSEWIEVDNQLAHYHAIRTDRISKRGDKAVRTLPSRDGVPGGHEAARELVYELSEYLSRRYPDTYSVTRHAPSVDDFGWYGEGQVKEVTILPLAVSYNLDQEDPMKVSSLLIQDDLALMLEGSDGRYYFQAGGIIVPGFWRLEDKIGMPLEEIHLSGLVPQYREKLQNSLDRFFRKLHVDKPVLRNNYFFQIVRPASDPSRLDSIDPDELAWSDTTNGDEDHFEQATKEPTLEAQESGSVQFQPPKPTKSPEDIRLRTERQSLRRLPRSGAVVFTIRTYIFPVVELAKEPGIPGRMASAIRSWPEDVITYKGQRLYRDAILPYLDRQHEEQVRNGVVKVDEKISKYPF